MCYTVFIVQFWEYICIVKPIYGLVWTGNWLMSISPASPPHASFPSFPAVMWSNLYRLPLWQTMRFFFALYLHVHTINVLDNYVADKLSHHSVLSGFVLTVCKFNMPLIGGATMCSFVTHIVTKRSLCTCYLFNWLLVRMHLHFYVLSLFFLTDNEQQF